MRKVDKDMNELETLRNNAVSATGELNIKAHELANDNHLLRGVLQDILSSPYIEEFTQHGSFWKAIDNAKKVMKED